jgi:hypothetical protein
MSHDLISEGGLDTSSIVHRPQARSQRLAPEDLRGRIGDRALAFAFAEGPTDELVERVQDDATTQEVLRRINATMPDTSITELPDGRRIYKQHMIVRETDGVIDTATHGMRAHVDVEGSTLGLPSRSKSTGTTRGADGRFKGRS